MRDKLVGRELKVIIICFCLVAAAASFFVFSVKATGVQAHQHEIEQIDKNIDTVLELTASSTAASAIISLLPDDQATPIANKLADFSSYFLIALSALYLEKYLVAIVGIISFKYLLPIGCLVVILGTLIKNKLCSILGLKVIIAALIIYFIIPFSINISDLIYTNYEDSIEQTIDSAQETANLVEDTDDSEDSQNLIDKIVDIAKETASTISGFATDILSNFIEALAIILVTSCLIPILVLALGVWIVKMIFSTSFQDQAVPKLLEEILDRLPD